MKKGTFFDILYAIFFPKKALEKVIEETYSRVDAFLSTRNAQIISFEFYYHDIDVTFQYEGNEYKCNTDRGLIYINDKCVYKAPNIMDDDFRIDLDTTLTNLMSVLTEKLFSQD